MGESRRPGQGLEMRCKRTLAARVLHTRRPLFGRRERSRCRDGDDHCRDDGDTAHHGGGDDGDDDVDDGADHDAGWLPQGPHGRRTARLHGRERLADLRARVDARASRCTRPPHGDRGSGGS